MESLHDHVVALGTATTVAKRLAEVKRVSECLGFAECRSVLHANQRAQQAPIRWRSPRHRGGPGGTAVAEEVPVNARPAATLTWDDVISAVLEFARANFEAATRNDAYLQQAIAVIYTAVTLCDATGPMMVECQRGLMNTCELDWLRGRPRDVARGAGDG